MDTDHVPEDGYMLHFGSLASRLETYLRKNGVPCKDADIIIEEISAQYVSKFQSPAQKFLGSALKQDPAKVFVDSAIEAIEKFLPEASDTFGSRSRIFESLK